MADLWQDEGFGGADAVEPNGDDDWDEGESLDTALDDGFDDPGSPEEDGSDEDD